MAKEKWNKYLIEGKWYARMKAAKACSDCSVNKDQYHKLGCPSEFCPHCDKACFYCTAEGYADESMGTEN